MTPSPLVEAALSVVAALSPSLFWSNNPGKTQLGKPVFYLVISYYF
jgi:hypothetical protein